jgi:hypothetical protein
MMKILDFLNSTNTKAPVSNSSGNIETEDALRILIIIRNVGDKPFSGIPSEFVSSIKTSYWVIESLNPLFLISAPFVDEKKSGIEMLVLREALQDKFTCVAGIFPVKHSVIGGGVRFGFGSTGVKLSTLVRASVLLSYNDSWIEGNSASFNDSIVKESESRMVDESRFEVWSIA